MKPLEPEHRGAGGWYAAENPAPQTPFRELASFRAPHWTLRMSRWRPLTPFGSAAGTKCSRSVLMQPEWCDGRTVLAPPPPPLPLARSLRLCTHVTAAPGTQSSCDRGVDRQ